MSRADLTGLRFGRLIALERTGEKDKNGREKWLCLCDCGNLKATQAYNLTGGTTKSCGCLRNERNRENALLMNEYRMAKIETLCVSCRHATNPENKCSWSGLDAQGNPRFEPVEGWTTEKLKKGGFRVVTCPIYEEG